uniref:Protein kinase domain-containing protein n=1 Tax=Caenorhabditis tropicalis TaxID=1561998 RepID=A0A1I7TL57_9PELO
MASKISKVSTQPSSSTQPNVSGSSDYNSHEENNQLVITTKRKTKSREEDDERRGFLCVKPGHHVNDYELIKNLGQGSYGTVWLTKHTEAETYTAMKISRSSEFLRRLARREITILEDLDSLPHPNIVKFLDSFIWEENRLEHVVMTFEVLGPDLKSVISNSGQKLHLEVVKSITRQLLEAISYMHNLNYVHVDIKASNVMLAISKNDIKNLASSQDMTCNRYDINVTRADARIVAKLADFGLAFNMDENLNSYPQSNCIFRAPEQILTTRVTTAVDMWSFGCLIHQIVAGSNLFACKKYNSIPDHNSRHFMLMDHLLGPIKQADFQEGFREKFANKFDENGNMTVPVIDEFLPTCYETAIQFGMTDEEAEEYSDFLVLFFKYNTAERITADAAIRHNFLRSNGDTPAVPHLSLEYPETDIGEESNKVIPLPGDKE